MACLDTQQSKTLNLSASDTILTLNFQLVEVDFLAYPVTLPLNESLTLDLVKITDLYVEVRKALTTAKEQSGLVLGELAEILEQIRQSVAETTSITLKVSALVLEEVLFKLDTLILKITMKCDDVIEASALTTIQSIYDLRRALYSLLDAAQQLVSCSLRTAQPLVHSVIRHSRPLQPVLSSLVSAARITVGAPMKLVFGKGRLYKLCKGVLKEVEDYCLKVEQG